MHSCLIFILQQPPVLYSHKDQLLDTKVKHKGHVYNNAYADNAKHAPAVVILHNFIGHPVSEEGQMEGADCNDDLIKPLNSVLKSCNQWSELALVDEHEEVDVEHSQDLEYC